MVQFLIVLLLFAVCLGIGLMLSIPFHLRVVAYENCCDEDGEWQQELAEPELRSLINLVAAFAVMLILFFSPVVLGTLLVHEYVMPLPLVYEVAELFSLDSEKFREGIYESSIPEDSQNAMMNQGMSAEEAQWMQRSLFYGWPVAAVTVLLMFGLGFALVKKMYVGIISDWRKDVLTRWSSRVCSGEPLNERPSLQLLDRIARQRAQQAV